MLKSPYMFIAGIKIDLKLILGLFFILLGISIFLYLGIWWSLCEGFYYSVTHKDFWNGSLGILRMSLFFIFWLFGQFSVNIGEGFLEK